MLLSNFTAQEYAERYSISLSAAKGRLAKMIRDGHAEGWIEVEPYRYGDANPLPRREKHYSIPGDLMYLI